jgi:hypothetical protein
MFLMGGRDVKSGATDDDGDASPAAAACDREKDDMHHIPRCLVLGTVFLWVCGVQWWRIDSTLQMLVLRTMILAGAERYLESN